MLRTHIIKDDYNTTSTDIYIAIVYASRPTLYIYVQNKLIFITASSFVEKNVFTYIYISIPRKN